jgi:hypothetical protein
MIKELTKNIPDFVKSGVQGARESFQSIEKELRDNYTKVTAQAPTREELKKRFTDFQKKAVTSVEKTLNTNIEKAYIVLNLPTRTEVDQIAKKVNKINADVRHLADARAKIVHGAKKAKPVAKKNGSNGKAKAKKSR